jgi:hypothetical protein
MKWIIAAILLGLMFFTNIDEKINAAVGGEGSFGWWIMMVLTFGTMGSPLSARSSEVHEHSAKG